MSHPTGTERPGPAVSLFDHALRLHRLAPDEPLPRGGEPYPDDVAHRAGRRPKAPASERRSAGRTVARVLDEHFALPGAGPAELAGALRDIHVPLHPDDAIADAAAERADRSRVQETGRWLVRHGTDRSSVAVGLALVAAVGTVEDFPLIQTIGLLSSSFGPLAAHALERRPGGGEALLWLAERVTGWGRVHVVEALCRLDDPAVRPWLLRRACDGDYLNAYFAGRVAEAARLHEALGELGGDSELTDHVGLLLKIMSDCEGMGVTLAHYPHASRVMEAHARQVGSLSPTPGRYFTVALLAHHLTTRAPEDAGCTPEQQRALRARYTAVLEGEEWARVAHEALAAGHGAMRWLAEQGALGP